MQPKGKIVFVVLVAAISLCVVARTFWTQDLQYARPTPVPASWKALPPLARPHLPESLVPRPMQNAARPTLLHFFNPDCPCSRFNLDHVRALIQRYGTRIRCVTVSETTNSEEAQRDFASLHLASECVTDPDGSIAAACGVYSTPQAVILDIEGRLIYRGNYNTGRYCTEPQSEYVRLMLDALLAHTALPHLPESATRAYGCALPAREMRKRSQ